MPDSNTQNTLKDQATSERLLVIGYVWPEPNSSAAGKHMLSLLQVFLQQGVKITFASPAVQGEHKFDLTEMGIDEVPIALNCSSFDNFVQQLDPSYVLFDRFMMEEQFGWRVATHCPNAIRILDTEDLHFLRDARHQSHKKQPVADARQLTPVEILNSELALREVAAIYRCDLSLIISSYELSLLVESFGVPKNLLHYCPFMLDFSLRPTHPKSFEQRQHFVSIGSFRHAPNWDAVLYLNNTLWPLIREQLPQAELHIYGSYPPPKATQLHNPSKGFFVDGWVKDASTMLQDAKVLLAPLRFGAGIKGKLTDAMMTFTPSVTTSIGAQGMGDVAAWPGLVEDTARDFANAAVALFSDKSAWNLASNKTTDLLAENFDYSVHATKLWETILDTRSNVLSHRSHNFTGRMLQHHSMKSTQYMAQWIEAKNRKF